MNKKLLKILSILVIICMLSVAVNQTQNAKAYLLLDAEDFELNVAEYYAYAFVNYTVSPEAQIKGINTIQDDSIFNTHLIVENEVTNSYISAFGFNLADIHKMDSKNNFDMGIETIDDYENYKRFGESSLTSDLDYSESECYETWGIPAQMYNISHMNDYETNSTARYQAITEDKYRGNIYTVGGEKTINEIVQGYIDSQGWNLINLLNFTVITFVKDLPTINFMGLNFLTRSNIVVETSLNPNVLLGLLAFPILRSIFKERQGRAVVQPTVYRSENRLIERGQGIIGNLLTIPSKVTHYLKSLIPSNLFSKPLGATAGRFTLGGFFSGILGKIVGIFGSWLMFGIFCFVSIFLFKRVRGNKTRKRIFK